MFASLNLSAVRRVSDALGDGWALRFGASVHWCVQVQA